jgi:hypothetical protein
VRSDGAVALHEPRPHVLYARPPGVPGVNSLGFNDDEFRLAKTPGTLRIACIGSSTTEGGNPEGHEGSYPRQLQHILEERTGGRVEALNFGMAGWTTAEEMVNYFLVVQDYAPRRGDHPRGRQRCGPPPVARLPRGLLALPQALDRRPLLASLPPPGPLQTTSSPPRSSRRRPSTSSPS